MSEPFQIISTAAGDYTLSLHSDDYAEAPEMDSVGFVYVDNRGAEYVANDGELQYLGAASDVSRALQDQLAGWDRNGAPRYRYSSAGIARYLRLKYGIAGAVEVWSDYGVTSPSTSRGSIAGMAWPPSDVGAEYRLSYVTAEVAEYRAYVHGDVFGWTLSDPAGAEIEALWGYYGSIHREYVLQEARSTAESDAERRIAAANTVGAGFIGIV